MYTLSITNATPLDLNHNPSVADPDPFNFGLPDPDTNPGKQRINQNHRKLTQKSTIYPFVFAHK